MVELHRKGRGFRCPCGYTTDLHYDHEERQYRDLPWGPWREVWLVVQRYRVACPHCGVRTEDLPWLVRNCTYTRRLADQVARDCRELRSISAVAAWYRLSWDTVKKFDREALKRELDPPDFEGLRRLGIDDFAIRKGHRYATAFVDLDTGRPLWIGKGRRKEDVLRVFREVFSERIRDGIKVVSMDMSGTYEQAVREALPQAEIVWDKFHVIKNYSKEVLDRVRLAEAAKQQSKEERARFKGSKWLVLKNAQNLRDDEPARLAELLKANAPLAKAHQLLEVLKECWSFTNQAQARVWFNGWHREAMKSGVKPLANFARKLKERLPGILAHCRHRVNNGLLEGLNNWIKVIKRLAFGYRDHEYFFLKIRGMWKGRNLAVPQ